MTDESTPHGRAETSGTSAFDAAAFEFTIDAETSAAITPAKAITPGKAITPAKAASGGAAGEAASGVPAEGDGSTTGVLPTFSEQLAEQLGGVRGVLESSIPVAVFIIVNFWALRPAMIVSIASALLIAIVRLLHRQTVRHAVNGLFGVAIGVAFAWKTGSAKDFYLPGIILSAVYGLAMIASVLVRRPLVGWIWSLLIAGGSTRWRGRPPMVRLFSRLTLLWAGTYLVKVAIQTWLFGNTGAHDPGTALGIARLALGYPPYALLLAFTVWSVRRLTASDPSLADVR
jgi:Protein of unknown function (DUF3159)